MTTQTFELDDIYAYDHNGGILFWVQGDFKATAQWEGGYGWNVTRIEASDMHDKEKTWRRIDDVPECEAICRGIRSWVQEQDSPHGYTDPNREHRLTAAELGVGRFA